MKFGSLLCLALGLYATGAAAHSSRTVLESRADHPRHWELKDKANQDALIQLTFMVDIPTRTFAQLESELLARSTPTSPLYGKWLSNDEVQRLSAPPRESVDAVISFLHENGIESSVRTSNRDVITATMSVAQAESLLSTQYFVYEREGLQLTRCLSYSLPSEVAQHVALVGPTTHFPRSSRPRPMVSEDALNTPDNLRSLYSVGDVMGQAPGNKQAVTAFLNQYYSESDLSKFWADQFPAGADTPITLVGDATTGTPAGIESMLDIEYMPAMGSLIDTGFWGFSGSSPNSAMDEPFLTWLYTVSNTSDADVPLLFSTSYGEDEPTEVPSDYADRINTEFIKCGLRGISLLFASGDSGATSDLHTCPDRQFMPMWPAGSPYITAVGGTTGSAMPESAWPFSSGGFSNVYGQPDWQVDAVATYLATAGDTLPASNYFNSTGRGFPDISAQATNYPVVVDNATTPVGGTSCASPCSGGVFGLLNDARLAAGKSSLGFLNPMLYANADALNDCTQGTQNGCVGTDGFTAISGWDPVTGLGSPNYEALLDVVMALP